MNKPLYCCRPFGALVESAGYRGIAAVATRVGLADRFVLQFRAVDFPLTAELANRLRLRSPSVGEPLSVTASEDIVVKFCPQCGEDLTIWIAAHPEWFASLRAQHSELRPPALIG